jgi:hypothetical protein
VAGSCGEVASRLSLFGAEEPAEAGQEAAEGLAAVHGTDPASGVAEASEFGGGVAPRAARGLVGVEGEALGGVAPEAPNGGLLPTLSGAVAGTRRKRSTGPRFDYGTQMGMGGGGKTKAET